MLVHLTVVGAALSLLAVWAVCTAVLFHYRRPTPRVRKRRQPMSDNPSFGPLWPILTVFAPWDVLLAALREGAASLSLTRAAGGGQAPVAHLSFFHM